MSVLSPGAIHSRGIPSKIANSLSRFLTKAEDLFMPVRFHTNMFSRTYVQSVFLLPITIVSQHFAKHVSVNRILAPFWEWQRLVWFRSFDKHAVRQGHGWPQSMQITSSVCCGRHGAPKVPGLGTVGKQTCPRLTLTMFNSTCTWHFPRRWAR